MATNPAATARSKIDQVCALASEVARQVLVDELADDIRQAPLIPGSAPVSAVGPHLEAVASGERLVTHYFACLLPGYRGWRWAVSVTRVSRSRHVTVCETVLLPGPEALIAPEWVPWQNRLQPGDLGVGDLLFTQPDDDRLVPGYLYSDDPAIEDVMWELGLGRTRVMSRQGRLDTAQRWYDSDHGPQAPISAAAPAVARCVACGFYLPLAGALRPTFGVCANLYAPDDGRVVSADHGCGAHSEVLSQPVAVVEELPTVYDDATVDELPPATALGPDAEPDADGEPEADAAPEPEPEAGESPADRPAS